MGEKRLQRRAAREVGLEGKGCSGHQDIISISQSASQTIWDLKVSDSACSQETVLDTHLGVN
jgi:hypothetical protein